jgi:tetratricopeptide (TPR) repeat protein
MNLIHKCLHGHTWEGEAVVCPTCAAAAESLGEDGSTSIEAESEDELPPPPGSCFPGPVAKHSIISATVPTIPGYVILKELGRGGMGVVYEARHLALNRGVALKVIRGARFSTTAERTQFRAEAEAIATLQHPNIVQVYEVGEYEGLPYLSLELVEGGSLASRIGETPLAPRPAAELVATLARAIQHAHSRGIIHRDLKPANILMQGTDGPIPKITDFGLAKRIGDDTGQSLSGQVIGTPAYMAPEQAAGQKHLLGPPTDVWALGSILYECLTARTPFSGGSSAETIQKVLKDELTPPGKVRPGLPRDLETICLKCLRKDVEQRYRTAGDLADDLQRFLTGHPVLARRTPFVERCWKWARRRPAAALLAIVSVAAAIALGGLGYRHFRELERFNLELRAKNETISRNNMELEERNTTILLKSNEITRERDRAEENLVSAGDGVEQMLSRMGLYRLSSVPHVDEVRAVLLEDALRFYDRLLLIQRNQPRLRSFQGQTLIRMASILRQLGRYSDAQVRTDESLEILANLNREANPEISQDTLIFLVAMGHNEKGLIFSHLGETAKARAEQELCLALLEKRLAVDPSRPQFRYQLACSQFNISHVLRVQGDREKVKLYLGRAQTLAESLVEKDTDNDNYAWLNAVILNDVAVCCLEENDFDRAIEILEIAVRTFRRLLRRSPSDVDVRSEIAGALGNLGVASRMKGYLKRAANFTTEAVRISEKLADEHPDFVQFQIDLCLKYHNFGTVLCAGDLTQVRSSLEWYDKASDRLEKLPVRDPKVRGLLKDTYTFRADVRDRLGDYRAAAADLGKAATVSGGSERLELRMKMGIAWGYAGEIEKSLMEANGILKTEKEISSVAYFDAGRIFALAAKATTDPRQAEKLAVQAVEQLAHAEKIGHFLNAKNRTALYDYPDLGYLRDRDDFKALRAKVKNSNK